jgi:hypothetical protein
MKTSTAVTKYVAWKRALGFRYDYPERFFLSFAGT